MRRSARPTPIGFASLGSGYDDGRGRRAPLLTLLVTLFIALSLGVFHNIMVARTGHDPVLVSVRTVLFPLQAGASGAASGGGKLWDYVFAGRETTEENARLRAENARLQLEGQSLRAAAEETVELRRALKLSTNTTRPLVPADVIALLPSPHFDSITVGLGTQSGIRVGSAARTASGLVGQVMSVGPFSSQVMLLTDLESGVGVLVRRGSKVQAVGVVEGAGRFKPLQLVNIKYDADIKAGDTVVTSGYGGVYPPDVPVGVILHVDTDETRFLKVAQVKPYAAQPGTLRTVLLTR